LTKLLERPQDARAAATGRHRARRRRRLLILAVLLVLCLFLAGEALALRGHIVGGRDHLLAAESLLAAPDPAAITPAEIRRLDAELAAAEADWRAVDGTLTLAGPLVAAGEALPRFGSQVRAGRQMVSLAVELSAAGHEISRGLMPLAAEIEGGGGNGGGPGLTERLNRALQAGGSHFERARGHAHAGADLRARLDRGQLVGPLAPAAAALDKLDPKWPLLLDTVDTLADLPPAYAAFMGFDRPKAYLVLGQNEDELRATGGFIGSIGLVTVDRGRVNQLDYKSSYAWDDLTRPRPTPPEPQAKFMFFGAWYLRDANWSPDFPTAARTAEAMFRADQGVQVDGVLALDPTAVGYLLEATGPIEVPGFAGTVTAENFVATTYNNIYGPGAIHPDAQWHERKNEYLGPLFKAVMARLLEVKASEAPQYLKSAREAVDDKRLQFYLHDAAGMRIVDRFGAAGRLYDGPADYLYPVDTTMAYSKVSGFIEVATDVRVKLDARGAPEATTVTLTYHNRFDPVQGAALFEAVGGEYFDLAAARQKSLPGVWADWLRLLVPPGATLIESSGLDTEVETREADGKQTFAGYFVIRPGETRVVRFTYRPPDRRPPDGSYALYVQRQPGTEDRPLALTIEAPAGMRPESPAGAELDGGQVRLTTTATRDQRILLRPGASGGR
jgi:hypothetical protein